MLKVAFSNINGLNDFGTVHCIEVPHYGGGIRAFPQLHVLCANSPCNMRNFPVNPYLTSAERKMINRTKHRKPTILLSKTADGMLFHIDNRLIAGMHGKSFYEPASTDPVKLFTIEDTHTAPRPFHIVFHAGTCDVHELSRHAITEHLLHEILATRPPCVKGDPQVIFHSPNLGTFSSRLLRGPQVHELKLNFLRLIASMAKQGTGVYNKTIRLNKEFSKLLMLKNCAGNVLCDRCVDGIVGYRVRPHNQKRTFVFVANSNDFHQMAPANPEDSMLQVMKMDYADTSKHGSRIAVEDTAEYHEEEDSEEDDDDEDEDDDHQAWTPGYSPTQGGPGSLCFQGLGGAGGETLAHASEEDAAISLHMTVQDINNSVARIFRNKRLEHDGCGSFHAYCTMLEDKQRSEDLSRRFSSLAGG